jgi:hypothetical protein
MATSILRASYPRDLERPEPIPDRHRVFHGRSPFLQEVPCTQTRPDASLLDVQEMCAQDGPSLPLAVNMSRAPQLQSLCALPRLYLVILLGVFCQLGVVDVERAI